METLIFYRVQNYVILFKRSVKYISSPAVGEGEEEGTILMAHQSSTRRWENVYLGYSLQAKVSLSNFETVSAALKDLRYEESQIIR